MLRLSLVGEDWQVVRGRMRRFRYEVQHRVGVVDWCWHVEPNPKGTGHHAHCWQRGAFLPQAELSRLADYCGMGYVVDVRRWRPRGGASVTYGLKLAGISYGVKMAEREESLGTYLDCNGGRLVHSSRGFWRDDAGRACSLREARQAFGRVAAGEDGDPGPWRCVRVA